MEKTKKIALDLDKAKRLFATGLNVQQVADKLGYPKKNTFQKALSRIGICSTSLLVKNTQPTTTKKASKEIAFDSVKKMIVKDGQNVEQIATYFDCVKGTIYKVLIDNNVTFKELKALCISPANKAVNTRNINELQAKYDAATSSGVKASLKTKINKLLKSNGVDVNAQTKKTDKAAKKVIREKQEAIEREEKKRKRELSKKLDEHEKGLKKILKFYEVDYRPQAHLVEMLIQKVSMLEEKITAAA